MPVCQWIIIKTRYWYGRLGTGMTSQYGVSLVLALGLMLTPHQSLHVDTSCHAGLSADRHQDVVLVWTSRHWYDVSVRRAPHVSVCDHCVRSAALRSATVGLLHVPRTRMATGKWSFAANGPTL